MVKSTPLTATRPPKRLVTPRATSRSAIEYSGADAAERPIDQRIFAQLIVDRLDIFAAVHLHRPLAVREDPFRPRQHQDHQCQPENPELVLGQIDTTEEWTEH